MSTNVTSTLQQGPQISDCKGYTNLQMGPTGGDLPSAFHKNKEESTWYKTGFQITASHSPNCFLPQVSRSNIH